MSDHKWSGWPGAVCLKCGSEDPVENAIGLNWLDPVTWEYDTPEHEAEVELAMVCPVDHD